MQSSFIKQAAILAAATLFVRFIGFLYRLPLTNLIGDEGIGLYGVGYQFYLFVLVMSSAGLPGAISKMVSERIARKEYRNAHGVFRAAMTVGITFGLAGTLLLWILAGYFEVWFGYPGSSYSIRALAPTILIVSIMAVFRGYFQGMNNTVPTAVSQVVEQVFNAIFSLFLAYIFIGQDNLEWAAAGGTAGTGIGAVLGLITLMAIYKVLSPKLRNRIRKHSVSQDQKIEKPSSQIKEVMATAFPIILGTAIYSIANFIDMAMVSNRMQAGGFDEVASRAAFGQLTGKFIVLTTLPVSISTALTAAVLPSIAGSTVTRDFKAVTAKIGKALRMSTLVSIPAAMGLAVMAEPIYLLLFPNHPEGAHLMQVGAISVVFLSLNQIATGALQGINKIKIPVIAAAAGAIVKIPLNYVLIYQPNINVLGAVISTVVCYLLAATINMVALRSYTKIKLDWVGIFIKPLAASVVMGLTCFVSHNIMVSIVGDTISTIASVVMGGVVYFTVLMLIGGIHNEDMERIPFIGRKRS
ncbi:MAG: polysaccharide biosynthesis protein [Defluviitaleaceae bacterium]|nr:polysaccharide biosynthesis protein [Defluviitaleaceae bacterium]